MQKYMSHCLVITEPNRVLATPKQNSFLYLKDVLPKNPFGFYPKIQKKNMEQTRQREFAKRPHNLLHCCHMHMLFTVHNFNFLLSVLIEEVSNQSCLIKNIHMLKAALYII